MFSDIFFYLLLTMCHEIEHYIQDSIDPYKRSWRLVIAISSIIGFIYVCFMWVVVTPWISAGSNLVSPSLSLFY